MYTLGIVVTSFLFLSRAWSRQISVVCDGGREEGDKWFDGCRWCVCQQSGTLCSPSECSELLSQLPPCQRVGSRWWDGCYHCTCHTHGIECVADRACLMLMSREGYGKDFLSRGACVTPRDARCICGIDGVPSCTAEVIDRDAYPATTIELATTFPSTTSRLIPTNIYNERFYKRLGQRYTTPYRTKRSSGTPRWRYEYHHQNGRHRNMNKDDFYQRRHSPFRFQKVQHSHVDPRKTYSSSQRPRRVHRGEFHQQRFQDDYMADDPGRQAVTRVPPSLLIITANRCRWGVRWYGGGLRCYCDPGRSITCGDPSFVASRIDGFRLVKAPCEEGQILEDKDACRICECQMNGVLLCRRSPSCPLPFLIKPLPMEHDDIDFYDTYGFDSNGDTGLGIGDRTDEFVGLEEKNMDWSEAERRGTRKRPLDSDSSTEENSEEDIGYSGDVSENSLDKSETNHKNDNAAKGRNMTFMDHEKARTLNKKSTSHGNDAQKRTETKDDDATDSDKHTPDDPDKKDDNDFKRTTMVIVKECKPYSRWLDGCKKCKCDPFGVKYCDDRRCLKAAPVIYEMPNSSRVVTDSRTGRPMQRPPSLMPSAIVREKPVRIQFPHELGISCGRHKVGQWYWDDCNMCFCTSHGPKCTAKNCG